MDERIQLNIGICDDDSVMLFRLEALCREILEDRYDLHFSLSQTAADCLCNDEICHIALLDVKLLESDGIRLAQQILEKNADCRIIFVSGYVHVVSDVYAVPHFCFVLKDQLQEKLPPYLRQAAELCAQDAGMMCCVKFGRTIESIPLARILYLERRGHYTYITLQDGQIRKTAEKLSSLHSRMGAEDFVRCHISYVVNLRYVRSIENRTLWLENKIQLPISLPHEQTVRDRFFRYIEK